MINWTQQMDEMGKQWSAAQKMLWASWAEAVRQNNQAQAQVLWQQILDAWQGSVKQMLDMQGEGMRLWVETLKHNDLPAPMQQWAEQLYQMSKQWTGSQQQLWAQWFQFVAKLDPTMPSLNQSVTTPPMFKLWEEMTQQAFSAQQQWMQNWTAWQPGGKNTRRP
jgi:hypothetical protein